MQFFVPLVVKAQENWQHGCCKHLEFAKAEIEWTARVNEESAAHEEFETFGRYL